jgi:hypothetical protein
MFGVNLESDISPIKEELMQEARSQRMYGISEKEEYSFLMETKYRDKLYNLFLFHCQQVLPPFRLADTFWQVWCYYTDKEFSQSCWHNHIDHSNINGVLYLQTVPNAGIEIERFGYYEPRDFDLIIFNSDLMHRPVLPPTNETRVSLNLEFRIMDPTSTVFGY